VGGMSLEMLLTDLSAFLAGERVILLRQHVISLQADPEHKAAYCAYLLRVDRLDDLASRIHAALAGIDARMDDA